MKNGTARFQGLDQLANEEPEEEDEGDILNAEQHSFTPPGEIGQDFSDDNPLDQDDSLDLFKMEQREKGFSI